VVAVLFVRDVSRLAAQDDGGGHLVVAGGGGVDAVQRGNCEDAVHVGQAADDAYHVAGADAGLEDLAVAEVGDEQ
jgi:hypothetical protein